MPQGRRKTPFSNKQKKTQLQTKREKKRFDPNDAQIATRDEHASHAPIASASGDEISRINYQHNAKDNRFDANRYALQFFRENETELKQRREDSRRAIVSLPRVALEQSIDDAFMNIKEIDMPKRPEWDYTMTPQQLEIREQKYFREYITRIEDIHKREGLSYFEINLETWRQLWRVLEMSDIILIIADIRHPIFHFPPSLYHHVIHDLQKDMILVLNKIDLTDSTVVCAWIEYLKTQFPRLHVVPFASYAGMKVTQKGKKRIGKLRMASKGAKALVSVCEQIVGDNVDLNNWKVKIDEEINEESRAMDNDDFDDDYNPLATAEKTESIAMNYQYKKYNNGIVTIGCVGNPNVGKSSLLNAIMGKKVVSVSRTPGHTKHFQTIFLTPTVKLCDCPGLIFPSRAPKQLQVLMGCYPIAQLREPYSTIAYLAERINLQRILKLQHPDNEGNRPAIEWSAYDICESWAIKKGFFTARAARPDTYRAANQLLRMALDGRTLCLIFYPPNFFAETDSWKNHPQIKIIESIQGKKFQDDDDDDDIPIEVKDESEDDDNDDDDEEDNCVKISGKFSVLQESE